MLNARRQAEAYARARPVDHGWPPFILVCDVGHVLEVYADFSVYSSIEISAIAIPLSPATA